MVLGGKEARTLRRLALLLLAWALGTAAAAQTPTQAPANFQVRLDTTRGPVVIAVHRDWAPRGADRFYELVTSGYYDNSRFFRVIAGRWAQFGIAADPAVAERWRERTFPDDPPLQPNLRGRVAFAFAVPNGRTTEVFINLRDNSGTLDRQGFAPFGEVVEGMDVVDQFYSGYGENSGGGIRAGHQQQLFDGGAAYLAAHFPLLDAIRRASILPNSP